VAIIQLRSRTEEREREREGKEIVIEIFFA